MELAIGLPLRNRDELDRLLEQVSDPHSPNYRQYLSAGEFADRFGPTQEDYDKLIRFALANGFTVSGTHPNRMILDVAGPVSTVNKALHIKMTVWEHQTRGRFFAPDRDPWLDVDVDVLDVSGIDNFALPRPMSVNSTPLASVTALTSGSGPAGLFIGKDFRSAYAPGVALTGAGQSIGLIEFDGFYAADVTANFKQAGLPVVPVQTVLLDGFSGSAGGSNIEVTLDIMMAAYMAPGASVVVYEGSNWNNILNRMATDNTSKQLSSSWSFSPINATTEQIFKQFIAQGQSFLQASGDSGAYTGWIMPPSDNPNVTVVGGTALTTSGSGGSWLSESAWSGSGGGVSTTYAIPSYQQSMSMAVPGWSKAMRNIPDVALTAAIQMFLIQNNGQAVSVGGTSAAAPLWAGFIALANQQAAANGKPAVGFLNPAIYALGNGSNFAKDLHDITTGNNGYAAIAGFDLATGWGTPTGQPLINDLTSTSATPSFGLTIPSGTASVQVGLSTTATVQVTTQNGFSGSVTLSASGLPAGVTATFSAATSSGASMLTLSSSNAAVPGTYQISINGVSGTLTSSATLNLVVTGVPGYSLKSAVTALTLAQGGSNSTAISVSAINGFSNAVNLSVSGLPTGVTAAFNPASTATGSTLSFVASATAAPGTTNVTVKGVSGALSSTVVVALTVAAPASFTLTSSTPTLTLAQKATTTSIITIAPKNGFSSSVTLAVTGLPSGVTASFSPASTATTSTLTLTATAGATLGIAPLTVTGTAGLTSTSVAINLAVKAGPSFTLTAAPASVSVVQGSNGSSTIALTPLNGFTGAANLVIAGLPVGVTAAFTPATITTTSNLTFTASTSAPLGAATISITSTSGTVSAQTSIALTVAAAPGFKLTSSTPNVVVAAGNTGTATISVTPQGGFTASVALAASGLPAGVTASFTPASASSSGQLSLKVASTTTPGAFPITVTGTSGVVKATLAITLTVTAPPDFALTVAPANLSILQGAKGTAAVSLTPLNGFAGSVMISISGLPSGVSAGFTIVNTSGLLLSAFTVSTSAAVAVSKLTVTATSGTLVRTAVLNLTVLAPTAGTAPVDLSPYYNVSASAADRVPFTDGGLDALGRSYSGILLGASQIAGGTAFSFGPMGVPDAISGQTVKLPAGQFTSLKVLATAVNGNQANQTFVVTYSDGTTSTFTQSLSDWFTPQNYAGETTAATTSYRDNNTGTTDGRTFYLYGYSLSLNSAKTVSSITIPKNRNVVVLAMTLAGKTASAVTAQADLSKSFNGIGIVSDGKAFTGGLDGVGYAYSGALLQGTQTFNNIPFQFGAADKANVVSGITSAIALPAGNYGSLVVLATAVNAPQLSQQFKVTYTDGTVMTFTQSLSDWFLPANYPGEAAAFTMTYRNAASGARDNRKFLLYGYTFSLNNTKTVASITLPASNNVKVFAMALRP